MTKWRTSPFPHDGPRFFAEVGTEDLDTFRRALSKSFDDLFDAWMWARALCNWCGADTVTRVYDRSGPNPVLLFEVTPERKIR